MVSCLRKSVNGPTIPAEALGLTRTTEPADPERRRKHSSRELHYLPTLERGFLRNLAFAHLEDDNPENWVFARPTTRC